ncbi:hypothetical protein C8R44DRAFT_772454 [Mycena epipterygia]|nr:hypothetical protein C8R44DRAFT_772454 [Mycena epipterygia]
MGDLPPIPPEIAILDNILLLVASWLNVALYTGELFLCRQYFQRPSRPLIHKIGVGALVFFDTLCTLASFFEVVLSVITFPNDLLAVELLKPLAATIFTTYAAASIEQAFLCNLYFHLSGNIYISLVLVLSVLVHTGFSFASAGMLLSTQSISASFQTTTIGAITCAVTDILITSCLCFRFWQMMYTFPREPSKSTQSLVYRIMIITISSGAVVASNTLIMMILLLNRSPVFQFFFICQGRVYSLMLLGNFLVGAPFNPSPMSLNTLTNINTTLDFHTHPEDGGRRLSPPPRARNSLMDLPSNYHEEERIDLKRLPSLSRMPPSSSSNI